MIYLKTPHKFKIKEEVHTLSFSAELSCSKCSMYMYCLNYTNKTFSSLCNKFRIPSFRFKFKKDDISKED